MRICVHIQKDSQIKRAAFKNGFQATIFHYSWLVFSGGILPPWREAQREVRHETGRRREERKNEKMEQIRQRRGKKRVIEKHYLLMYSSETAHYKPEQQRKVQPTHTHTYGLITEESTKQSTVAHRGKTDMLKSARC